MKKVNAAKIASFMVLGIIGTYVTFLLVLVLFVDDWQTTGSLGDSFGIINTIFSGVALAGVTYTLVLQVRTFELQRQDYFVRIKPLLAVEPTKESRSNFFLNITNIGNGTALNIDFIPAKLAGSPIIFKPDKRIISLQTGQSIVIEIKAYKENDPDIEADILWTPHLIKKYANQVVQVEIKYQDIEFRNMKQAFELGLGDLKVTMVENL